MIDFVNLEYYDGQKLRKKAFCIPPGPLRKYKLRQSGLNWTVAMNARSVSKKAFFTMSLFKIIFTT